MNTMLIPNLLDVSLCLVALFIAVRSFDIYTHLHTDWFVYIGQTVGLLFILLSLARSSDSYLRGLMRLNMLAFAFLLILLLLSAALPELAITTRTLLGLTRLIICVFICIAYMNKQARFSLFMSIAFFYFAADYVMTLLQYYAPSISQYLFRNSADIAGVIGLVVLVAAVSVD
jgi:hypothetical protein